MSELNSRVIAVMNQQPETGKTRLAAGLGQALADADKSVLLIDMATQGDLSTLMPPAEQGIGDVLQGGDWSDAVMAVSTSLSFAGYQGLSEFELGARDVKAAYALKRRLQDKNPTDFVVIDTASRKGLLSMNVLLTVDEIIIPVSGSARSIEGVQSLMPALQRIEKQRESPLRIWLCLVNCADDAASHQMLQLTLANYFPERLLRSPIPADENTQADAYAALADDLTNGVTFHG